jgi:hypothetical protein
MVVAVNVILEELLAVLVVNNTTSLMPASIVDKIIFF